MKSNKHKKPILVLPIGLKSWFMKAAYPDNLEPIHDVVEVDPTHPGLDEFVELMRQENEEELDADVDAQKDNNSDTKPKLKLVYSNGKRQP